ncbi:MAG: hypothetical protein ACK4G5_17345, partial [Devosia sp.]
LGKGNIKYEFSCTLFRQQRFEKRLGCGPRKGQLLEHISRRWSWSGAVHRPRYHYTPAENKKRTCRREQNMIMFGVGAD